MEFGIDSQMIRDVLKDMKYENKYVNSLFSKREELNHIMNVALAKKKREIETILQRNSQLERNLEDSTDEKHFNEQAEELCRAYMELSTQIKSLQRKEKDLLCEINNVLSEKENLKTTDRRGVEELSNLAGKLKALSHLYINFLRIRWIPAGEKLYGYVGVSEKELKRFEVSEKENQFERVNANWNELESCLH